MTGKSITWTDTLGGSNSKFSYNNPAWWTRINFAHVEAVEAGVHQITIPDQVGCKVASIQCSADSCGREVYVGGAGTIDVPIKQNDKMWSHYIYVYCSTK